MQVVAVQLRANMGVPKSTTASVLAAALLVAALSHTVQAQSVRNKSTLSKMAWPMDSLGRVMPPLPLTENSHADASQMRP